MFVGTNLGYIFRERTCWLWWSISAYIKAKKFIRLCEQCFVRQHSCFLFDNSTQKNLSLIKLCKCRTGISVCAKYPFRNFNRLFFKTLCELKIINKKWMVHGHRFSSWYGDYIWVRIHQYSLINDTKVINSNEGN